MFHKEEQNIMYYNNRPGHRRRLGWYGFPWIFFGLFWWGDHQLWFLFILAALATLFFFLYRMRGPVWGQQPNQQPYYTPPVQQQPARQETPYYQPPATEYYRPYEQGYQPVPAAQSQSSYTPPSSAPEQEMKSLYEDYEEPRAEYPEEMPPMQ